MTPIEELIVHLWNCGCTVYQIAKEARTDVETVHEILDKYGY